MWVHNTTGHNGTFNCERWLTGRPARLSPTNNISFHCLIVCSAALSQENHCQLFLWGMPGVRGMKCLGLIAVQGNERWWMQADNWLGIAGDAGSGFELDLDNTHNAMNCCKLQHIPCSRSRREGNGGDGGGGGFGGNWGDSPTWWRRPPRAG